MVFKALKCQILRGSLAWRLVLRVVLFVLAMVIVSVTRIANEIRATESGLISLDKCSLSVSLVSLVDTTPGCVDGENFTVGVIRELMNQEMLSLDAKTLCVGDGSVSIASTLRELGFSNAFGVYRNPLLALLRRRFEHKLDFESDSFDFVFSRTMDGASVPAITVMEIERVLRPGGLGAILVGPISFHYMRSLVRSATPVSLMLRGSEIIHVCGIDSFTLIVFKKHSESVAFFENYKLPDDCPAVSRNKPFMEYLEPISDHEPTNVSYLPKFANLATRKRLIYINMGAGELDENYPVHPDAFNVYVVDHNVSALTSHVKKPGVTFVYHPGLVDVEDEKPESSLLSADYLEAPLHEEQFEFIDWFKETAKDGDFVVLMMNAGVTQLKVLVELFASGAICHVDELFVKCYDGIDCGTGYCRDCASLYDGLRNAGVFVHQWFGE